MDPALDRASCWSSGDLHAGTGLDLHYALDVLHGRWTC